MIDLLPFPQMLTNKEEDNISNIHNYLLQLKESLEFVLTNIDTQNLSNDFLTRLETLGADVSVAEKNTEDYISQIAARTITVKDVVDSNLLKEKLDDVETDVIQTVSAIIPTPEQIMEDVVFTVNVNTGNLEYTFKEE